MSARILIVDDERAILLMLKTLLTKHGFVTLTATNGQEGLDIAQRERPDLVIADVMMPVMDGWTLVREMRTTAELSLTPVIFLTALNSNDDRIRGFSIGADDYLPKPFNLEELVLRVKHNLQRSQRLKEAIANRTPNGNDPIGIRGDISQLGLSSLLTLLEMDRKSGVLVVSCQTTGRIFLREGRILNALIEGQTDPHGAEALYQMLGWTCGSFEFSPLEVDMADQVNKPLNTLLKEGAQRINDHL